MKKALALVIVLLAAASAMVFYLLMYRGDDDKNTRLGYQAMENGDYERAKRLYGFAVNGGKADSRDIEIYSVLSAYLNAEEALKNEDFNGGAEIIGGIDVSYYDLPVAEDMEALRIALAHGLDVDDRLEALERAVSDGSVGTAEKIAEELSRLDMTEKQRERYFSLRRAMTGGGKAEDILIYYIDQEDGNAPLYERASESAEVIERIPDGGAVEVLELTENGFVRARYEGTEGYLPFRCLSPSRKYRDEAAKDGADDDVDGEAPADGDKSDDAPSGDEVPFMVSVEPDNLPDGELAIYSGPGKDYSVSGSISSPMVLTIVEVSDGWGRLKSGAGWIDLSGCKRK